MPSHAPTHPRCNLSTTTKHDAQPARAATVGHSWRAPFSCCCCCWLLGADITVAHRIGSLCLCSLPFPHNCWRWLAFVLGSGQLLSVRVENRLSLSVRASRHRPKACKTTPFPFLLDLYPSRILFCPLCSRRSNRQTFPPLSLDCVQSLSHDTRTHLFARSDSSLLSLVTALAP